MARASSNICINMSNLLEAGCTISHGLKFRPKDWFSEIKIYKESDSLDRHLTFRIKDDGMTGWHEFEDATEAINFYGTLVFNVSNLSYFFKGIEKYKMDLNVENIEYMSEDEIDVFYKKYSDEYFAKDCPHADLFDHPKALELIGKIKSGAFDEIDD